MSKVLIWGGLALAVTVPVVAAAMSPLLAWRQPVYIIGGFAGIIAMVFLLVQPLLAIGALPGLEGVRGKRVHRWVGLALLVSIIVHVAGLWITSPPDMIDALTFTSPTPFSAWGVIAMWALYGAAFLAAARRRLRWRPARWRTAHAGLATVTVLGSVAHAVLIEGAMEAVSKFGLCLLVLGATGWLWRELLRRGAARRTT